MRKIMLVLAGLAALAAAGVATAMLVSVSITGNGFTPQAITLTKGDTVRWTNNDTSRHRIVADDGTFTSPTLRPGDHYSRAFPDGGTFRYHDAFETANQGVVVVNPQPQAQPQPQPQPQPATPTSVGLTASRSLVVFGSSALLSGDVSSKEPGESVTIVARAFGHAVFSPLATVTTGNAGNWSLTVRPRLQTTYVAHWKSSISPQATIQVRPLVSFRALVGRRFITKVAGARSFAGRVVNVQRRLVGRWVTMEHVRLGLGSRAIFRVPPRRGTTALRVVITKTQAGPGYLAGISRTIVFHRA
jgi:plastocyanin